VVDILHAEPVSLVAAARMSDSVMRQCIHISLTRRWAYYRLIVWSRTSRWSAVHRGASLSQLLLTAAAAFDVLIPLKTGLCPVNFPARWTDKAAWCMAAVVSVYVGLCLNTIKQPCSEGIDNFRIILSNSFYLLVAHCY